MLAGFIHNYKRMMLVALIGLSGTGLVSAQDIPVEAVPESTSPLSINHSSAAQAMNDGSVADAINIGVLYSPADKGLQLRAGAWKIQSDLAAAATPADAPIALYIDDSSRESPFGPERPTPQGIDLSAAYVWESPRFGQFILSTKASYMYDLNRADRVEGSPALPSGGSALLGSDLQGSLTLTWQIGKHRASAVTHHADQVESLGTVEIEELNKLVGSLTTLDLEYGYTLKAGRDGEAVISVGVRSILDNPTQSLARPVGAETSDRMAYGTIKYQF